MMSGLKEAKEGAVRVQTPKKRVAKKKTEIETVETEHEYECPKCKDTKVIYQDGEYYKCTCVLKAELKYYLSELPVSAKYNPKLKLSTTKSLFFEGGRYSEQQFFDLVKTHLAKTYVDKAKNNEPIPNYFYLSGMEWTDWYVQGDTDTALYADQIFLMLGRDNKNTTQHTSLLALLNFRKMKGLMTWIYVYPEISTAKLTDLWGRETYAFIQANFTKVGGSK